MGTIILICYIIAVVGIIAWIGKGTKKPIEETNILDNHF